MSSRTLRETSLAPRHPPPTKVSSISTTHENKGVNSNRSHEVPGKSSTNGTAPDVGKSGGFSLDALVKAKRALQIQKDIQEKLKKISAHKSAISRVTQLVTSIPDKARLGASTSLSSQYPFISII